MSKTITHLQQVQIEQRYNRIQVLWLTGLTDSQLAQLIYETGVQWLMEYTGEEHGPLIRELLAQPAIWAWWKNEWHRRDERFLPTLYRRHEECRKEVRALYSQLHQGIHIIYTPPHTLLANSYAAAIGTMHDELKTSKTDAQ